MYTFSIIDIHKFFVMLKLQAQSVSAASKRIQIFNTNFFRIAQLTIFGAV